MSDISISVTGTSEDPETGTPSKTTIAAAAPPEKGRVTIVTATFEDGSLSVFANPDIDLQGKDLLAHALHIVEAYSSPSAYKEN